MTAGNFKAPFSDLNLRNQFWGAAGRVAGCRTSAKSNCKNAKANKTQTLIFKFKFKPQLKFMPTLEPVYWQASCRQGVSTVQVAGRRILDICSLFTPNKVSVLKF